MKKLLVILILLCSHSGFSQNIDSAWVVNHYSKREVMIPMRDGVKLFTAIYLPSSSEEKHPFILFRTGYSAKPYGVKNFTPIWNSPRKYFLKKIIYMLFRMFGDKIKVRESSYISVHSMIINHH